jgi:hypothetical protein
VGEKNDTPSKAPQPQNSATPERPKIPANRVIQGNDPAQDAIRLIDSPRVNPKA